MTLAEQDEFLKMIIREQPHINIKVAEDWLENVIQLAVATIDQQEEYHSQEHRDELIHKFINKNIFLLGGFSGGDMSALIMEYNDEFCPFSSAEDVIRRKICLDVPEAPGGDLERGIVMNPIIRKKFEKEMPNLRLYPEAFEALKKFKKNGGCDEHPWLTSSANSVYQDKITKELWLVDFRCPSSHDIVIENYKDPALYFRAQLAQYKYHLKMAGINIDRTAIIPFSMKEMKCYISEFTVTPELTKNVLDAGDYYWKFVLRNELPKRPPSQNFEYIRELPPVLQKIVSEFILIKKLESISKDKASTLKEALVRDLSMLNTELEVDGKKTRIPGVDISYQEKMMFDSELFKAEARKAGVDPDDSRFYNPKKQMTISVIRSKKSEHTPFIEEIQELANRSIQDALIDVMEHMDLGNMLKNDVRDPTEPSISNSTQKNTLQQDDLTMQF